MAGIVWGAEWPTFSGSCRTVVTVTRLVISACRMFMHISNIIIPIHVKVWANESISSCCTITLEFLPLWGLLVSCAVENRTSHWQAAPVPNQARKSVSGLRAGGDTLHRAACCGPLLVDARDGGAPARGVSCAVPPYTSPFAPFCPTVPDDPRAVATVLSSELLLLFCQRTDVPVSPPFPSRPPGSSPVPAVCQGVMATNGKPAEELGEEEGLVDYEEEDDAGVAPVAPTAVAVVAGDKGPASGKENKKYDPI